MLRLSSLLFVALASIGAIAANKTAVLPITNPIAVYDSPQSADRIVCFVTDSTNALLPEVVVTLSDGSRMTTSWDGRFEVALPKRSMEVVLTCWGCDTARIALSPSDRGKTLFFCLRRNRNRSEVVYSDESTSIARVLSAEVSGVPGSGSVRSKERSGAKGTSKSKERPAPVAAVEADMHEYAFPVEADMFMDISLEDSSSPLIEVIGVSADAFNTVSAGRLTAGEVNDFAKWHLWPSVLDGSHRAYASTWGLRPALRYVLQLTNTDGYPLVNAEATLLDGQGEVVFRTKTDNTGRAELWNGLTGEAAKGPLMVAACGDTIPAKAFADGLNTIRVKAECHAPASADVFFIFDATGSMRDELRYLRAEMKDVIARSQLAVEGLHIRTGALVYRDHGDDYLTRVSRLSDDIQLTQSFIVQQRAGGGGDYAEAVPEALMASLSAAGWDDQARARIAFLILDAPCHDDPQTIQLLHEQVVRAAAMGVRLVPIVCSGLKENGELLMRSLALSTNATSFFLTDDSGIGYEHLKPTTDSLKVEHLNDMMVRTIISYTRMPECVVTVDTTEQDSLLRVDEVEQFLPNPFDPEDLDTIPQRLPEQPLEAVLVVRPNPCVGFCLVDLPMGADALFLSDLTGKTVASFGRFAAPTTSLELSVRSLSTGVYFVKAFIGGRWYTQKLLVR